MQIAGPNPVSVLVGLEWGLSIHISKFLGDG